MTPLHSIVLRSLGLAVALLGLVGGALTLAADRPAPAAPAAVKPKVTTVVVPDVRGQVYVFAKGILEDGGLAWQVKGTVHGYAANIVLTQRPAPGAIVVDNGAPTVTVTLGKNRTFSEHGVPEDASPYPGTPARLARAGTQQ